MKAILRFAALLSLIFAADFIRAEEPVHVSGRYPHLVMSNKQGECGTGAVVEWAGKLWAITYAPHKPEGSDDKLYEIDGDLTQVIRKESVGGTPAARLIHKESNQLLIGPYLIDDKRNVRVIPPKKMFGRISAVARHLSDPENKVYYYDMEGLIYEVDVKTLDVKLLYKRAIPGWHGKGAYSAQGHLVVANNGEHPAASVDKFKPFDYQVKFEMDGENAGGLGDWDGKTWKLEERRQFTEVTGPGGILGSPTPDAPLWAVGWDKRSLLLKVLDGGAWSTFRMPKMDYSYDGAHGWHTEWPRIREVVPEKDGKSAKLLMNMHGGWFDFPKTFSAKDTSGLKPMASYLKITGDFAPWKDRIVFACDDVAASGFSSSGFDPMNSLNGQSQSNLWFSTWENLSAAGKPAGFGGPWIGDDVKANAASIPYLFSGFVQRVLHLSHDSDQAVAFTLEVDADGKGSWKEFQKISVPARGYAFHIFPADTAGQWVRLKTDRDAPNVSAYFHYGPGGGAIEDRSLFTSLADVGDMKPWTAAVMRAEGEGTLKLAVLANAVDGGGKPSDAKFFHVDGEMKATIPADEKAVKFLQEKVTIKKPIIQSDDASVIVIEEKARYRLPKSGTAYDKEWATGWPRVVREVVTERSLMNAGGSFYVLPRTHSGGIAHIKPVCTHNKRIVDFCSWRGILVLSGTRADAKADGHYFNFGGTDAAAGLWYGDIDDLWKMGKPKGKGGPWLNTMTKENMPSDPYLMTGYDKKTLKLSHDSTIFVQATIEVDFLATGKWEVYQTVEIPAGQTFTHEFPAGYSAHWVRVRIDRECRATAEFTYE